MGFIMYISKCCVIAIIVQTKRLEKDIEEIK